LPISGWEINRIRNGVAVGGIDRNKFVALAHLYFAKNLQILARAAAVCGCRFLNEFDKRQRTAVEDGEFKVASSTMALSMPTPINATSRCSVVEMSTPFFHEAGGVADAGYVAADGLDRKAIEIERRKTIPVPGGPGMIRMDTGAPEW